MILHKNIDFHILVMFIQRWPPGDVLIIYRLVTKKKVIFRSFNYLLGQPKLFCPFLLKFLLDAVYLKICIFDKNLQANNFLKHQVYFI